MRRSRWESLFCATEVHDEGEEWLLEATHGREAGQCADGRRLQHDDPRGSCRDDGLPAEHRAIHECTLGGLEVLAQEISHSQAASS